MQGAEVHAAVAVPGQFGEGAFTDVADRVADQSAQYDLVAAGAGDREGCCHAGQAADSASRPPVCHLAHRLPTALSGTLNKATSTRPRPSTSADTASNRTASRASGDQVCASPTRSLTHRQQTCTQSVSDQWGHPTQHLCLPLP